MTLAGKDDNFTRDELLKLGAAMDVPADGARIIEDVERSLAFWEQEAAVVDVPRAWQEKIAGSFRHFAT
jgi:hypothetical protein